MSRWCMLELVKEEECYCATKYSFTFQKCLVWSTDPDLLRIGFLLDRVGQAHFLSTLDLTKCYWQIPLRN